VLNNKSALVFTFVSTVLLAGCTTEPSSIENPFPETHRLSQHEDDFQHHDGELLVMNPPKDYEKTLPEMGLSLIDITHLDDLELKMYHLKIVNGTHPFEVRLAHKNRYPGVIVDVHHHFEQHKSNIVKVDKSYTSRKAMAWGTAGTKCGEGIRMGMIDGGVDTKHPAFRKSKLTYRSFHLKGQKIGAIRHGTAVANVLVGNRKWGGLLPDAELFAANVFYLRKKGGSRASSKSIVQAISWLFRQKVDVINFSIGGSNNKLIAAAVRVAHKKGILLVASAGNNGPFTKKKSYPGAYLQTIAIAASDRFERSANFSSAGNYVEFTAPGVGIWTAVPNGGKAMSGTSFSSPIVTGIVATAMRDEGIDNLVSVRKFLRSHANDRGKKGWDKYTGWGFIDIKQPC